MSGHQCTENPPHLDPNSGSGHVEKLGNLDTYVSGSTHSKLAVLLVSHVFGYETPNLRKLADKVAEAGFYAVVPDFFHGDPYNPEDKDRPLLIWAKDHGQEKGFEDSKPIVEALKNKGITSIGAAGFCWGAKVAVELAKQKLVDATVLLHPSRVTVDDIKEVNIPIAVLGAELDQVSPPELVRQFEDILASKPEVKSFVKIFPSVKHGWTVRYNENDPSEVEAAEEAHKDMLAWLIDYVK
ncbi:Dienelactone hydrolase [Arabidopsis thaliana x Arabidopsis arenosa]|uniref:Dienelactone hydrolase n=1 Tax=Arabidopsis thaliana x Arabidopsis arenosa TaxID=1240361 RepID=A0A8T2AVW7_9BRAS|nr:Dienelactone hydrolase [Arabidopsis thaliana x Arabidopsis arenosa]